MNKLLYDPTGTLPNPKPHLGCYCRTCREWDRLQYKPKTKQYSLTASILTLGIAFLAVGITLLATSDFTVDIEVLKALR